MHFLKKDIGATLCLFLLFLCVTIPTYNKTNGLQDVGEYLNNPVRVLHGEMPYRDFWLVMPPMEVIAPAAVYALFGVNINILLGLNAVMSAVSGVLAFLAGRQLFEKRRSAIAFSLAFFFGSPLYHYAGYNHSNWFFLFFMLATYYFIRYLKTGGGGYIAYSGGAAAVASLFRAYETVPLYVAGLTVIAFSAVPPARRIRNSGLLMLSGVIVWITVLAVFFPANALKAGRAITIDSVQHALAFYTKHIPAAFSDVTDDIENMRKNQTIIASSKNGQSSLFPLWRLSYYSANFMRRSTIYAIVLIATICAVAALLTKKRHEKQIILWLLVWTLLAAGKAVEGIDGAVLAFAAIPALILLLLITENAHEKWEHISLKIILISYLFFSIYVTAGEQAYKIKANTYPIRSDGGVLFSDNRAYAEETESVIRAIGIAAQPDEYMAVLHTGPYPFVAATGRRSATYYDSLIDLKYRPSPEKEKKICDDMRDKKTKIAVLEPYVMQESSGFKGIKACIRESFDIGSVYDAYLIYYPRKNS